MTRRLSSACLVPLLIALLWAVPGAASAQSATVGSQGEIYSLLEGSYGELFPDAGGAIPAESPVLVLDVTRPDGSQQRLLIPGTETAESEDSASLVFEDESETLFILWQTRISIHSYLNLASYRAGRWSRVTEIWGSPFGWKNSPQLTVTRDLFKTLDPTGAKHTWNRTVLHVIWGEDRSAGLHTFYSPIVLVNGSYVGSAPVYDLSETALALGVEGMTSTFLAGPLESAARIQSGRNTQTVVIGFVEPTTRGLVTLEMEILPGEWNHLADRLGHQIIEIGREHFPGEPDKLAGKLGHQIIEIGRELGLHPGLTAYTAAKVEAEVLAAPPDEALDVLADKLGHQIIEIGARMTGRGVDRALAKSGFFMLDVSASGSGAILEEDPRHLIRASVAYSRPLPAVGTGTGAVRLFLSRTGVDAIVAWETEKGLSYVESRESGWSEPVELRIGRSGAVTLDAAVDMLRSRAAGLHHEAD